MISVVRTLRAAYVPILAEGLSWGCTQNVSHGCSHMEVWLYLKTHFLAHSYAVVQRIHSFTAGGQRLSFSPWRQHGRWLPKSVQSKRKRMIQNEQCLLQLSLISSLLWNVLEIKTSLVISVAGHYTKSRYPEVKTHCGLCYPSYRNIPFVPQWCISHSAKYTYPSQGHPKYHSIIASESQHVKLGKL